MRRTLLQNLCAAFCLLAVSSGIGWAQAEPAAPAAPAAAPATPAPATTAPPAAAEEGVPDDVAAPAPVGPAPVSKEELGADKFEDPRKNRPNFREEQARRRGILEKAVTQLKIEALALDDFKVVPKSTEAPKFTRPHPLVKDFTPDMALDTLDRMLQPFTGNEYRDTYIKWHLLWALDKATPDDRYEMGKRLVALIKRIPGTITVAGRREWYYDPEDVYLAWKKAVGNAPVGRVVTGFPPFQRVVQVPESFKYMTADQKAKYDASTAAYKAKLEANKALEEKFKIVRDPAAVAFNHRVRNMNHIIRQYRGELLYALLLCGDAEMAKLVCREIDRQARARSPIAFDMLAFVYKAAFDGALNLYDQATLNEMSTILEGAGRAMEPVGYVKYGGQIRFFPDYVFHIVYMLKDGGGFIDPKEMGNQTITRKRRTR